MTAAVTIVIQEESFAAGRLLQEIKIIRYSPKSIAARPDLLVRHFLFVY